MKGKYLKRIGGFVLAALMLSGIAFVSSSTAQAQGRRVIVRSNPYRIYRPFGYRNRFDVFGYDRWGYDAVKRRSEAAPANSTRDVDEAFE